MKKLYKGETETMLDIALIDNDIEAGKEIKKILANIKVADFVESYETFSNFLRLHIVEIIMM